jgi:hypothetical protein
MGKLLNVSAAAAQSVHVRRSSAETVSLTVDPYPWAIEEGFDVYRTLVETKGSVIGIKSGRLDMVLSGDSA